MSVGGVAAQTPRAKRESGVPAAPLAHGFTVAWLVAGVLLLVLFVHLLQSAALSQGGLRQPGFRSSGGYVYRSPEASFVRPGGAAQAEEESQSQGGAAGR